MIASPRPHSFALALVLAVAYASTPRALAQAPEILAAARALPPMPADNLEFRRLLSDPSGFTIAAGGPFDDLAWTLYDTDYVDGETAGYDTFCPVDPTDERGEDGFHYVLCTTNTATDNAYGATRGDRIILGLPERDAPFFLNGDDGVEDDYVVIRHFDYRSAVVELAGDTADYALNYFTEGDGVDTEGYYLFYTGSAVAAPDLIAFIYPCFDVDAPRMGTAGVPVCNADSTLSFARTLPGRPYGSFVFRAPDTGTPAAELGLHQLASPGKDMTAGLAVDDANDVYLFGATDGNLDGGADASNELFVTKISSGGERLWTTELPQPEGALLWDGEVDDDYLYVAGRTLGALPGFTNAGGWDGILLKLDRATGEVVATDQWGNAGLDGYGNLTLDDGASLYVSGAGSPPGQATGDSAFLVAKHARSDLSNVWRRLDPAEPDAERVAEAWGGLSYVPGSSPGAGRVVAGGWFISVATPPGGANGWVRLYDDVGEAAPRVANTQTIASPGFRADWILDNVVDERGYIYAAGYTTGALDGEQGGEGDAFVVRYDSTLGNPRYLQFGTERGDLFRKLVARPGGGVIAVGYSYGDFAGDGNADSTGLTADVIVQSIDEGFAPLDAVQYGSDGEERAFARLRDGVIFLAGYTERSFTGPAGGSFDGFVLPLDAATLLPTTIEAPLSGATLNADSRARPLRAWPNPVAGDATVFLTFVDGSGEAVGPHDLEVIDARGRRVYLATAPAVPRELRLPAIPAGQYVLRVSSATTVRTARLTVR